MFNSTQIEVKKKNVKKIIGSMKNTGNITTMTNKTLFFSFYVYKKKKKLPK